MHKTKLLKAQLQDVLPVLDRKLLGRVEYAIKRLPREVRRGGPESAGDCRADWRDLARRVIKKVFPKAWVYAGGSHLAVHASPPEAPARCRLWAAPISAPQAGACLFRIVELPAEPQESQ